MTYKDFSKVYIGESDTASLTVRGNDYAGVLHFGKDGAYSAYLVDKPIEIPEHYYPVFTAVNVLKIYDDNGKAFEVRGRFIQIYRAGEMGCLIKVERKMK